MVEELTEVEVKRAVATVAAVRAAAVLAVVWAVVETRVAGVAVAVASMAVAALTEAAPTAAVGRSVGLVAIRAAERPARVKAAVRINQKQYRLP